MSAHQVIHIHAEAPAKPALGAPCNGCGVCCLAEPCPLGQLISRKRLGACDALRWDGALAAYRCGVLLGRDMEIVEALPKAMPALLESGKVDALCTAEPAGSAVVLGGGGRIVTTGALIWHNAPEKMLAVKRGWAEENAAPLEGLLRALYRAGEWCAAYATVLPAPGAPAPDSLLRGSPSDA